MTEVKGASIDRMLSHPPKDIVSSGPTRAWCASGPKR